MELNLQSLLMKEKRKQVFLAIAVAIIASGLILGVSFGLRSLHLQANNNSGPSDHENPDANGYVLGLNSALETEYQDHNIAYFRIAGNITSTIHPRLITSLLSPDFVNNQWTVDAFILHEDLDPYNGYEEFFNFTTGQVSQMHTSFLTSLTNTQEIAEPTWPIAQESVPSLLIYDVYFTNGTALQFSWIGFDNLNIIEVSHRTWQMSLNEPQYNPGYLEDHYLSPLSAFDSFITTLQSIYAIYLG